MIKLLKRFPGLIKDALKNQDGNISAPRSVATAGGAVVIALLVAMGVSKDLANAIADFLIVLAENIGNE